MTDVTTPPMTVPTSTCSAILIRLERAGSLEEAAAILRELKERLQHPRYTSVRRAFTIWVRRVLLRRMVPEEVIPEVNDLEEVNAMLAERVEEWTKNWKQQGLQEGLQQGRQEGRQEGQQQGLQESFMRLLSKRFGPVPSDVTQRVNNAPPEQITRWFDQAIDAPSLDKVFDN